MSRGDPNPYIELELGELYNACQRRAGDLMRPGDGVPRTPQQRAALALDTAHLLLAIAPRINVSPYTPDAPEQSLARGTDDVVGAFSRFHDKLARDARHKCFVRAADYALGRRAEQWMRDGRVDGERVYELAIGSDAGFQRVLVALAGMRSR